jgi:hypothetical protein
MGELIKFDKYKDTVIKLTKLKDTKFDGKHPNHINEGYVKEGVINVEKSNEHQCFLIIKGDRFFNTSQVMEIEEQEGYDLAHTLNSIYKVEPVFTAITGVQEKHSVEVGDSKQSS